MKKPRNIPKKARLGRPNFHPNSFPAASSAVTPDWQSEVPGERKKPIKKLEWLRFVQYNCI
jgi:hypothetical protein